MPKYNTSGEIDYLNELPRKNGAIELSQLAVLPGGGTHEVYISKGMSLGNKSSFVLKVVRGTIGKPTKDLNSELLDLTDKYNNLYSIFGETYLQETRYIESILKEGWEKPKQAIISIGKYDHCFETKEQFGFNSSPIESDGIELDELGIKENAKRLQRYHLTNLFLTGVEKPNLKFKFDYFLEFQESFKDVFDMLDDENEESLRTAMKDFLNKFKEHYKKTNRLMDLIGINNVLFYKEDGKIWRYKVGTVLKHETGLATIGMLEKIRKDPSTVNNSFQEWTQIFYVPSWVRLLNATALKLGMNKIVDDIKLSKEDSERLANIYKVLPGNIAISYAKERNFEAALKQIIEEEVKSNKHDTRARDLVGVKYWTHIQNKDIKRLQKEEIKVFYDLLTHPKNKFPNCRWEQVISAIVGLLKKIEDSGGKYPVGCNQLKQLLNRIGCDGGTPLFWAAQSNNLDFLLLLLKLGADPSIVAENGVAPIHIAAEKNHTNIVTALVKEGAKFSQEWYKDQTENIINAIGIVKNS